MSSENFIEFNFLGIRECWTSEKNVVSNVLTCRHSKLNVFVIDLNVYLFLFLSQHFFEIGISVTLFFVDILLLCLQNGTRFCCQHIVQFVTRALFLVFRLIFYSFEQKKKKHKFFVENTNYGLHKSRWFEKFSREKRNEHKLKKKETESHKICNHDYSVAIYLYDRIGVIVSKFMKHYNWI